MQVDKYFVVFDFKLWYSSTDVKQSETFIITGEINHIDDAKKLIDEQFGSYFNSKESTVKMGTKYWYCTKINQINKI